MATAAEICFVFSVANHTKYSSTERLQRLEDVEESAWGKARFAFLTVAVQGPDAPSRSRPAAQGKATRPCEGAMGGITSSEESPPPSSSLCPCFVS